MSVHVCTSVLVHMYECVDSYRIINMHTHVHCIFYICTAHTWTCIHAHMDYTCPYGHVYMPIYGDHYGSFL